MSWYRAEWRFGTGLRSDPRTEPETSCCSNGSTTPHRCCPLASDIENVKCVDRGKACVCPRPKLSVPVEGYGPHLIHGWFFEPTHPSPQRIQHLDRLSRLGRARQYRCRRASVQRVTSVCTHSTRWSPARRAAGYYHALDYTTRLGATRTGRWLLYLPAWHAR